MRASRHLELHQRKRRPKKNTPRPISQGGGATADSTDSATTGVQPGGEGAGDPVAVRAVRACREYEHEMMTRTRSKVEQSFAAVRCPPSRRLDTQGLASRHLKSRAKAKQD
jgi:hypothetical protein